MRRFLATAALAALMAATLAGCSKKENTTEEVPTVTSAPNGVEGSSAEYIALGGYFTREDANLTIYISESGWRVIGMLFLKDSSSPLVLNAPLSYTTGTDMIYEADGEKLTFTFAADSVKVTSTTGTAHAAFAGEYRRTDEDTASGLVVPENGSAPALLGRIAAAYYIVTSEDATDYTLDLSATILGNDFLCSFITAYADLFLANSATVYPEISSEYLCYAFSKTNLDNVLRAATAGAYDSDSLTTEGTEIVLLDGVYYVPCRGNYAGGLTSAPTPEQENGALTLEAVIAKKDGSRLTVTMTLSTSENAAAGPAGIQIDSVTYKTAN